MERAPATPAPGTPATDTVEHAGKLFESLLFPSGENTETPDEPEETPPATGDDAEPTDPQPETTEDEPVEEETEPEVDPEADLNAPPATTPRVRKLKLPDGSEEEVTEDEAYAGYLRQQDYTRKTQTVAAERKEVAEVRRQAQEARAQHLAALTETQQALNALVPKEPDWASLKGKLTPEQYATAQENWRLFETRRKEVADEQVRVAKEIDAEQQKEFEEQQAYEEQQLLNALPSWRDTAKQKEERGRLVNWLRGKGYSDEQIATISDHRLVVSLRNAMLWEEFDSRKGKPKATKGPKPAGSGSPPPPPRPVGDKARENARNQLRKTGRIADAGKVFEQLID